MKLYTSYFAKCGHHPLAHPITAMCPPWVKDKSKWIKELAPTWSIVTAYKEGRITQERYEELYLLQLNRSSPHYVVAHIPPGAILLCYERPGEFCHRHIAAKWLMQVPGVTVEEWTQIT